jgi:hypothetical protein
MKEFERLGKGRNHSNSREKLNKFERKCMGKGKYAKKVQSSMEMG